MSGDQVPGNLRIKTAFIFEAGGWRPLFGVYLVRPYATSHIKGEWRRHREMRLRAKHRQKIIRQGRHKFVA
jgi:hypothetical protein